MPNSATLASGALIRKKSFNCQELKELAGDLKHPDNSRLSKNEVTKEKGTELLLSKLKV